MTSAIREQIKDRAPWRTLKNLAYKVGEASSQLQKAGLLVEARPAPTGRGRACPIYTKAAWEDVQHNPSSSEAQRRQVLLQGCWLE